ncbi:xanthine dehydrogenase family protein molybdopterin-binding subunit [Haladaptatus sp. ZSTT2]|uniref:xanthine dehydrogenase family protein molybdopterin-binding subunit n=1 Tax=Haladaptatus sp. ZSTT2 TaxID=3120515 RepID=UPI00300EE0BE
MTDDARSEDTCSDTARTDGGAAAVKAVEAEEQPAREKNVGQPLKRKEDNRLTTGRGRYIEDLEPVPNLHYIAVLRSPLAHANIESIDASAALELPGVKAVVTGQDVAARVKPFPAAVQNPSNAYYPIAVDKVRYYGEPVAVVVADDRYRAHDALEHIRVSYDRLDPILDPEEAVEDDAPQVHEGGNVANHRVLEYGDVEAEFDAADHIVEERFEYPRTAYPPLETYGVIADYDDGQDTLDIWANFQGPFSLHAVTTAVLPLPENRITLRVPSDQGGGFGVKCSLYPYMVLLSAVSMEAGVPVKWVESRQEHLLASSMHANRVQYLEGAVDDDGNIRAIRFRQYDDYGGYVRPPEPGATYRPIANWQGPYTMNALGAELFAVRTNKCPTGPNRGYGCHLHYFALEGLVDRMAETIDMDPAELRLRNFIEDDAFPFESLTGGLYDSGQYEKAMRMGLEAIDYENLTTESDDEDTLVGIGMAAVVDPQASNMGYLDVALPKEMRKNTKSGALEAITVIVGPDATVKVDLTDSPQGQGHETTVSQIVADELGVPFDAVKVNTGIDTSADSWAISSGTYSSRFGTIGHAAVAKAAGKVRDQILTIGAHLLGVSVDRVELRDEAVVSDEGDAVSLRRIAGTTYWDPQQLPEGVEPKLAALSVMGMNQATAVTDDDKVNSSMTYAFGAHFAVVEVNKRTGVVNIRDYVTVHDPGTVVNPLIVRGQIEGGTFHGYASTFYEFHEYDETGTLQTDSLMDYAMPTIKERLKMRHEHVETPSPFTEIGSKGTGEAGTQATVPALSNAVRNALIQADVDLDTLPITPDRVWELLHPSETDD